MNEPKPTTTRRWLTPVALGAAGLVAGGVLAGTLSASAADTSTPSSSATSGTTSGTTAPAVPGGTRDESTSQRPDEKLLTGTTASKVTAAALAKHPGATVLRVETDSDGVYEAHLTLADGSRATVEVGKDFTVTGTETGGPSGGGPGHAPGA